MKKESNESTKELVKDIFTNNSNEVKPLKLSVTLHGILGKEKCLLIEKRYNEYDNLIEQRNELLEALKNIAAWPGNLPDERYLSKTGANDAALRGSMVVTMRQFANAAIQKAESK